MSAFYTVDQVANLIDMHPKTVRRYIQSGKINANKVGSQYRISQNELNSFIGESPANNGEAANNGFDQGIANAALNNQQVDVEVNSSVDIFGVDSSAAAFLTQRVLSVLNKLVDVRADCIYYESQHKLKVLLFGNIETTDQMLKHINILVSQSNIK